MKGGERTDVADAGHGRAEDQRAQGEACEVHGQQPPRRAGRAFPAASSRTAVRGAEESVAGERERDPRGSSESETVTTRMQLEPPDTVLPAPAGRAGGASSGGHVRPAEGPRPLRSARRGSDDGNANSPGSGATSSTRRTLTRSGAAPPWPRPRNACARSARRFSSRGGRRKVGPRAGWCTLVPRRTSGAEHGRRSQLESPW